MKIQANIKGTTYEVGGHDGIQTLGVQNHASSHGINQHLIDSNIGEVSSNLLGNFVPENHSVTLSVTLGNNSQKLSWALLSSLESETNSSLNTMTREDGNFRGNLPRLSGVRATTLACILTLTVFTNDDPV